MVAKVTDDPWLADKKAKASIRAKKQRVRIRRTADPNVYTTKAKSGQGHYTLHVYDDGSVDCDCVGYGTRKYCKHDQALHNRLAREDRKWERL